MSDIAAKHQPDVCPYMSEVEYLESTGSQYIDLGVKGNQDMKAVIRWMATANSRGLFGAASKSSLTGFGCKAFIIVLREQVNANLQYIVGAKDQTIVPSTFIDNAPQHDGKWHTTEFNCTSLTIDGVLKTSWNKLDFETEHNLLLFTANKQGTIQDSCYYRISNFKLFENDELIMDLVPVIDHRSRPAMYDKIGGKMFYSERGGDFKWGE